MLFHALQTTVDDILALGSADIICSVYDKNGLLLSQLETLLPNNVQKMVFKNFSCGQTSK